MKIYSYFHKNLFKGEYTDADEPLWITYNKGAIEISGFFFPLIIICVAVLRDRDYWGRHFLG